jgi:hypothetical protein
MMLLKTLNDDYQKEQAGENKLMDKKISYASKGMPFRNIFLELLIIISYYSSGLGRYKNIPVVLHDFNTWFSLKPY